MASVKSSSEFVCLHKLFIWEIQNPRDFYDHHVLSKLTDVTTTVMTAVDPYNGTKYTGVFNLHKRIFSIVINPNPGIIKYFYYYNDEPAKQSDVIGSLPSMPFQLKKLTLYVDASGIRHHPFNPSSIINEVSIFPARTMQMWKNEPIFKFYIKCKGTTIEAIKPIMTSYSTVFARMFDHEWKESTGNVVEITDFDPEVVQKMVEFCENGTVDDLTDKLELFKIADKYDIQPLMGLTVRDLTETMTVENVRDRLLIARRHKLKNFKKYCIIFCVQNGIYDF